MSNKKQRVDMIPGVKYKGYGTLNSFGEFEFIPEQTGSRKGQRKLLKMGKNFTISETNQCILIHLNVSKQKDKVALMREYLKLTNNVLSIIKDYEI